MEHSNQSNKLNEARVTLKRRYTENHPAITAGKTARIRNKMLEAIADGQITQEEFNKILKEMSANSARWAKINSRYFNVSEDGVTLSKSGHRILKQITSNKTEKPMQVRNLVMESFSDFINENNQPINEGTRGQFGKIDKKGNISSIYTHYDSYPESTLPIIKKTFKGGKNVDDVISNGACSGLDADISKINFYNDGTKTTTGSIKSIDKYLKDVADDGGAEFVYLWDESSKNWMMADIYGETGLVPAFESLVIEAFKSSKLRNLLTMSDAMGWGKNDVQLPKAFYQLTKMKLDQIGDEDLIDITPKEAYKAYAKNRDAVVFFLVDNDKPNPFGEGSLKPGILALTRGKDFLGVQYERTGRRDRSKKTLKGGDDRMAVGGNKVYKGYDATGIYNIKRASELADRAIVFSLNNTAMSSKEDIALRVDQKAGATAFMNDADFKKANLSRYKEILATKASKLPLDKMVADAIDELTSQIKEGLTKGEKGRYGDILIGRTPKDREVKMRDASNHMSNILDDYSRYVDYTKQANAEQAEGYSSKYYEKESQNYAKEIKDKCAKIKKFDYAW